MHKVYFDGASRGNPGPASYGASLVNDSGEEIATDRGYLGIATNNYAEYFGCKQSLKLALANGIKEVSVYGDSKLVILQVNGIWKIRHDGLKVLHREIMSLIQKFRTVQFFHVRRHLNKRADELANQALDEDQ